MRKRAASCLSLFLAVAAWNGVSNAEAASCVRVVGAEWNAESIKPDPTYFATPADIQLVRMLYDPFIDLDDNQQPVPVLAESWEASPDGSVWTFHVRQGVKFHDGSPLTAEDVVWTYRRLIDPDNKSPALAELGFLKPESFKVVDPATITVTLDQPRFDLPIVMASMFALVLKDKTTGEQINSKPNGTGAFTLPEFTPGSAKYVLNRNSSYWRPGLPKAECIELSAITESVPRVAALLSGAADIVTSVDPATAMTLADKPNVKIIKAPGGTALSLSMFTDTAPFNDVKVRQALKLVVDRQKMVDTALLGFGIPGNDNPIPPTSPDAYRSDLIPRDLAKVKQLLTEAGHPDGLKVDLNIGDTYPGTMAMGQVYKQMAAEGGIDINLVVTPAADFYDAIWLKKPFVASNWGARPTGSALAVAYRKGAPWNESHWFRDDYDALLDKASVTADADERRKIYQQAQKLLSEEGGVVIPMFFTVLGVLRDGCSGYTPPANHNRPLFIEVSCQ